MPRTPPPGRAVLSLCGPPAAASLHLPPPRIPPADWRPLAVACGSRRAPASPHAHQSAGRAGRPGAAPAPASRLPLPQDS
eukprot:3205158-Pleurochrysis_carterae.AAC.1